MDNFSKKPKPSLQPYTQEEFRLKLDKMLAGFGISVTNPEPDSSPTDKPSNYQVKFLPPQKKNPL